ncbi:TIL domain-containing protein [Caenorhabditis elegans]|uniref:TIL domain-containing protein n=1 Tax=Caenorhabditis elegans TaxID=6239 RepID=P90911_CAEEL|nr:TIL domain-containing protein [Caenorhabditis elegans]CAB03176.1 TIL domain-containing protein [Caenorhabditis elegans]|eukprot:NP_492546.1 Uncharacterized protein CELE_K07A1.6 [Caenorhabditis elegans]
MQLILLLVSLLMLIATFIEARDSDIDKKSLRTERLGFCPRYETWRKCGNGCEKSCTHPRQPPFSQCKLPCIPYSCRCNPGFYRDNQGTGRCVRLRRCKKW